ncbi:MAG: hypothetical protein ACFE8U_09735 [Candidatus Hermodarchaeota archaeon]
MNMKQESNISEFHDLKLKIESEKSHLQQRILDFKDEGINTTEAFSRTLDHSKTKILSEIRSIKEVIDQLTVDLEEYKKKTLESEKDALSKRIENLIGEIASAIDNLQIVMEQLCTIQNKDISKIYAEMGGRVRTGLTDIYDNQWDQLKQFEHEISSHIEKIRGDLINVIESEQTNKQEYNKSFSSSINDSLRNFQQKIHDISKTKENEINSIISDAMNKSVSRLEIAREDLSTELDVGKNNLDETIGHQKTINDELYNEISENVIKSKSEVKNQIEKLHLEMIEEWKSKQNDQLEALKAIKDSTLLQYKNDLNVNETFQSKLLSNLEHQMRSSLYTEIDNISLSFTKFQDSFVNNINTLISHLTNFRDDMKKNLDLIVISNLKKIGEIGKQAEENLSEVFSEVSMEYENSRNNSFSKLSEAVKERYGAITNYVDQLGSTLDKKMERTTTDLDAVLLKFHDTTGKHIEEAISNNNSTLTNFQNKIIESFNVLQDGQAENIKKAIIDLQEILKSKQNDLVTAISLLKPMVDEHTETHQLAIDTRNEEFNQVSMTAFNDLKSEIDTFKENSLQTIIDSVETTHHQLDDNVKSSEEKVQNLIKGLEKEHESQIEEFRSKINQEANQKQQMLTDYRSTLTDKLTKFFEGQSHTLDHFIDESLTKKETVNTIRKNLENKINEVNSHIDSATGKVQDNLYLHTQNIINSANQIISYIDIFLKSM